MESFWKGTFAPLCKRGCNHGNTSVTVGEPEMGMVPVYVEFNHTCPGGSKPPSNDITYTLEVELDEFTGGESSEAQDLQTLLLNMTDSERLKWVNDQLGDQTVDSGGRFW